MQNRLAEIGNIMTGDAYIHRKELEKRLLDRTVNYDNCGSVNVVGLQRMGKSSMVYNVLEAKSDEYYEKNIVIARISANTVASAYQFFKCMAEKVYKVIKKHKDVTDDLKEYFEDFKRENIEEDGPDTLQFFFESVKDSGKQVVCIIDEFDNCAELFSKFPSGFAVLRELASDPKTHIAFVFVSRRQVVELERKCSKKSGEETSPFYNILGDPIFVKCFSDEEMEEYYKCNETSGVVLNEEEKETLKSIAGGQPYWSDLILKAYKEAKDNGKNVDVNTIFYEQMKGLYDEYEHMLDLLEDQGLKNKLYQIMFGPMDDCTKADIRTLYNYGVIIDTEDGVSVFSKELEEYMKMQEIYMKTQEMNDCFYPLWHKAETKLRKILKSKLADEYKPDWEKAIMQYYFLSNPEELMKVLEEHFFHTDNPVDPYPYEKKEYTKKQYFLSNNLFQAEGTKRRMENKKKYGVIKYESEISILEAILTRGLFLLYEFEYEKLGLKDVFGGKDDFVKKANHLTEARNTYQHNNDELLSEDYKMKTKKYCEELCKKIDEYEAKNN